MGPLEELQEAAHVRRELFDRLWRLLNAHGETDPKLMNFDKWPGAFSLTRNGHRLIYQEGPGTQIGSGEMQWRPGPNHDRPHKFSVGRSAFHSDRFVPGGAPPATLEEIAAAIMSKFLYGSNT